MMTMCIEENKETEENEIGGKKKEISKEFSCLLTTILKNAKIDSCLFIELKMSIYESLFVHVLICQDQINQKD